MSASNSKLDHAFEDEEIFDDSTFLANFDNISFKQTKAAESNVNDSHNTSGLNVSALCCDEEISGYDKLTGQTWIYPTNYSVRDYQFNIIKAALVKNTLVSLPTGLGKTFIAAVIMYNFYRWYPLGKIVFTAPTRPLVAQQIEACYNIVAIPPNDTIEMTGHMQVTTRKTHWQTKRVFFATPQVIYNDLKSGICPADKIRCLVIDEAHRARGNYAYCQIVGTLDDLGVKTYRLLALSATPGSKVEDVINVVRSLHISHLELRTENCIDVAPYSHTRKINTVVIPLGPELTQLRQQYVEILDYYARRLKQFNILPQNLGNLSKGRVVMLYKEYQTKDRGSRHPQHNYIMKDFTVLIALYHGLELLVKHGSRVFLNFFDEHPEKAWIQSDDRLTALLERLRDDLGVNPMSLDTSVLPDGTIPEVPRNLCFGHPKFDRLKNIMVDHFTNAKMKGQDTRAIVFCEYRESVNLVHCLLLQCRPLITPQMFVGQGASGKDGKAVVSQKQQLRVMRAFRAGECNALVATCVAEEGLDVGSVDLILCFDVSTRSPVRLVQRCGRTGRERGGQVFILVTEGREHQTLMDCMRQRDGLNKKIQQSKEVGNNLYKFNPRMMPHGFTPRCQKMYITVSKKHDTETKKKTNKKTPGQKDLRSMLAGRASTSNASPAKIPKTSGNGLRKTDVFPDDHEFDLLPKSDAKKVEPKNTELILINSQDTQDLAVPSPVKKKQTKKKHKTPISKSPVKNYGDIRALFSTGTKSTKNYTKLINELGVNDASVPTKLINLLVELNLDSGKAVNTCYICQNICNCKLIKHSEDSINKPALLKMLNEPYLPNINLIDDMDAETILKCSKSIESTQDILESINIDISLISKSTEKDRHNCSVNFDLEFDLDAIDEIGSPEIKAIDKTDNIETIPDTNFDLGDIDDIFAESSPEETVKKELESNNKEEPKDTRKVPDEALGFFGLDSIDDIFADSDDSVIQVSPEIPVTVTKGKPSKIQTIDSKESSPVPSSKDYVPNIAYPLSPSILSGQIAKNIPTSPILCSQSHKSQLSTKKAKPSNSTPNSRNKLVFPDTKYDNKVTVLDDDEQRSNVVDTTNKSMFTITQLVEMINKTQDKSVQEYNKPKFQESHVIHKIDLTNEDERSKSPVLLTQADRKKTVNLSISKNKYQSNSLIILDSDSDSSDTQLYDVGEDISKFDTSKCRPTNSRLSLFDTISKMEDESDKITPDEINKNVNKTVISDSAGGKRKFDEEDNELITASPYFKKQKLDDASEKPVTLQQKVLAAISSNKNKREFRNDQSIFHFTISQPNFSQKENANPQTNVEILNKSHEEIKSSPVDLLQKYKKENKILSLRRKFNTIFNKKSPKKSPIKINYDKSDDEFSPKKLIFNQSDKKKDAPKKKIKFDDSDDDFVNERSSQSSPKQPASKDTQHTKTTTNHKVRKKKRKHLSLLDMEAELSDSDSGDELTDDSEGSIAEFICDDDDVTHHDDMLALYLKSVRSPVKKNGFKIPELPQKYNKADVFSQFVQEDAYEMDSFCVDSHIGLTQVNDISELELAEIVLKEKKRKKHRSPSPENRESPVVKRKFKKVKTLDSDSDENS